MATGHVAPDWARLGWAGVVQETGPEGCVPTGRGKGKSKHGRVVFLEVVGNLRTDEL